MCTSPSFVWVKRGPEWVKVPAPCDLCWSCRENYVSDWVGRCLCEAATSSVCCTLSLTYAPPTDPLDLSSRVVDPYHFQLFMKRLRKAGHKVRYLAAGEYGDLKGRAHFHVILFFKALKDQGKAAPRLMDRAAFRADPSIALPLSREMPQEDMCHIREWPHGHVVADWSMTEKSVRYCCEYINPRNGKKKNGWFSPSKKPALGAEWFAEKAAQNREYGVLPSSFEYLPPGGKPGKKYLMTGATRRDYLNLITLNREDRPRMSKWVRATFDKLERQAFKDAALSTFDDDAFLERQMPEAKARSLLVWQEGLENLAADAIVSEMASRWGFDDVEEWEAFMAAGGAHSHPEYYVGPSPRHLQGGGCKAGLGKRRCDCPRCHNLRARSAAVAASRRVPTRYDREGKPLYGPEGREYIAGAFARGDASGTASDEE